ncbi:MAG: DUF3999 family protein [Actinobacteria bacterium]|nr:DUF3999 family protein [Actinomycetota bacterium]
MILAALGSLALALAAPAAVEERDFRYTRVVAGAPGSGPITFTPDGRLFEHARIALLDLRVVDSRGRQVPWRRVPATPGTIPRDVRLLNAGRQGELFVALLDLGRERRVHNRLQLEIPGKQFVGRVTVLGSDNRRTFTRLATTTVYDLSGAVPARSTDVLFPPSDFRYLRLRAAGVRRIDAAAVSRDAVDPPLEVRPASMTARQEDRRTVVELDLGYRKLPVDALRFSTTTSRFDRIVRVAGSNDRSVFAPLAGPVRIVRRRGVSEVRVFFPGRHRSLRVTIDNGDDAPLARLRVVALGRARTVLLAPGYRPPFRLLYGNPTPAAPRYDFRHLPIADLRLTEAQRGSLGPERANPSYLRPEDTRSFFERHPLTVELSLAAAAAVLALGGFLALRRRA